MKEIIAQPLHFNKEKVESAFKKLDQNHVYQASQMVYYPYYYFRYNVQAKRLFLPANEKVGCAVDAVSGKGSLIDSQPKLKQFTVQESELLHQKQSLDDCLEKSESFLYRSLSLKMKMLSISKVQVEEKQFFYRPYWIVYNQNGEKGAVDFIVDGVSGQYHPLAS